MTDAFPGRGAPFDAGHYHVPRDGLAAPLARHVGFIRPYLIPVMAEDADEVVRRRTRYLFASWAALFHNSSLPLSNRAYYDLDHICEFSPTSTF
jgi:hypothetical protein